MGLNYQSSRPKYQRRSVGIWLEVNAHVEVVLEGVLVVLKEDLRQLRYFHHGNLFWGSFRCLQGIQLDIA